MRIITDVFAWTNENVPESTRRLDLGLSHARGRINGGAGMASRSATALLMSKRRSAPVSMDKFAPRLSFFFNAHSNFLEEVAKFRRHTPHVGEDYARPLPGEESKSWMLRFHAQTAGSTLTAQQPENNIVRTAIQAMAAVLGGTAVSAHQFPMMKRWRCPPRRPRVSRCARSR